MKLSVIALDYDGTIARNDVMGPRMREAIANVRAAGILVLLVTGRILDELRRVAGDLGFVDGVVAENGAVLYIPQTGHTTLLGPDIPGVFLDEVRRQAVPHRVGQRLLDADAGEAPLLLSALHRLELPIVLAFNGGRVMALPQGISKATGLEVMLRTLRRSPRNMLAVGDAENDHEMLRYAEVGAAVEWGSPVLRAVADTVVPGSGPAAVADYIETFAKGGRLPTPARTRRRLRLGFTSDGREFSLGVKGRNVLVAGDPRSGKSWVAGLLCEQLILHGYCLCVLDPEGDYTSLEALPGVMILGGDDPLPRPLELLRAFRYPDRSVVVNLSRRPHEEKVEYIRHVLTLLNELRRRTGLPHRIVVDEAHYFLHAENPTQLLDLDTNGYTFITYRVSGLPGELLGATEVMIVSQETNPEEIRALRRWCCKGQPGEDPRWAALGRLAIAQAMALPVTEESGGQLIQFSLGSRLTPHVRHRTKYVDVPVGPQRGFVFARDARGPRRVAQTLNDFVGALEEGRDIDAYLRRGDFSRWIADVLGDHALAVELRELEAGHRSAPAIDTAHQVIRAIRTRYELDPP